MFAYPETLTEHPHHVNSHDTNLNSGYWTGMYSFTSEAYQQLEFMPRLPAFMAAELVVVRTLLYITNGRYK